MKVTICHTTQLCSGWPSQPPFTCGQFHVPGSNPLQGWHMLSRNPHQDCLSNGSSGQTKQDLAVQHKQLRKQVQAVKVSSHVQPPPWLWNMDPAC